MSTRAHVDRHSLVVQLVLSFLALILLTTTAVGLPAVLLIRSQANRQTWARLDQGRQTTAALYDAWQLRIDDLALLTSQRPTLIQLIDSGEEAALAGYLQALQQDTELDLLLICDAQQRAMVQTPSGGSGQAPSDLCGLPDPASLYVFAANSTPQVWMAAGHPIGSEVQETGRIVVGMRLDDEFARQMSAQTGLEHTLLAGEVPAASSLNGGAEAWGMVTRQPPANPPSELAAVSGEVELEGRPYYATQIALPAGDLSAELALDVTDMATAERRLTWMVVGSIFLVALAGSILGVALARHIGHPLTQLTGAATAISQGDLATSLSVPSRVREVRLVSQALENARLDLQQTLNELQQERAWTDHLLEAISEGIMVLDKDGRVTFFSPGAERLTGRRQDEAINQTCDALFQVYEQKGSFSQHIPLPGQRSKVQLRLENGRQITLGITSAILSPQDSERSGLVLVLRDISEAELTHRLLGEFLANITHEFRTPLAALAASSELLLDQAPDLSPGELQELLTSLASGIISLQTLIDNLLESASLETGRFRVYPHPTDLGEIVAEATHMMQPLLEKHGQELIVEMPATFPLVQADSRRIVQVLVNLLVNAIKYSPDDTKITVGAAVREGRVRITVADQGPGVPPDRQDEMFYQFVHYDGGNTKSRHGAGLGLSVVKAIVEAHGGQVGVENRPGGGAIFSFTLPAAILGQ
jgi:two-component system phosphate regulon sensor histidine kinase PhoR